MYYILSLGSLLLGSLVILDAAIYNSVGFFFVALGILISIRFVGFPDLTVDGSFTLGAALYAVGIKSALPIVVCFFAASAGGFFAGCLTAGINDALKIGRIISGVLVMLFLITVVPYLTGGSTVGILNERHWLSDLQRWDIAVTQRILPNSPFSLHLAFNAVLITAGILIVTLVGYFFVMRLGIQMRYLGSSVSAGLLSPVQKRRLLYLGLGMGNGLIGLGGAIEAERNGGFSQNMGMGTLLIGLAILVLGESLVKTKARRDNLHVDECLWAITLGALIYSLGLQVLLRFGFTFLDVRLTTTLFLLILLAFAARRHPNSARLF